MVSVTVWNEYLEERTNDEVASVYPDGIHETLASGLRERGHDVRTATLDEPDHGLTEEVLDDTDVLVWWEHRAHEDVDDEIVERVCDRIYDGMGFVPLHSAHFSKVFKRLMGTPCSLTYRESRERERVWTVDPSHPITAGLEESFVIPETEMYGEPFSVPEPDQLVFVSWFEGGEVFRSGCCYQRGTGRIFYFRPGHETYPVYHEPVVLDVIDNAVRWAVPQTDRTVSNDNVAVDSLE
ncbi:trehalose utilization protein [Halohasta litchfieldiae]|jgi:trehalose utilization protein|uniref:Trehalose utilization protein n=1 Tax=Halohasta litchfieldiae TaxID=1073996 RepID=A0A1H6VUQ0_9EURY|nr:ThuA domain-containing protein [Halohasta litchfieldiae]ATW89389.1 trehalose utilization protein [Halohasta litchfieldiae]SEJ05557.1 Trehalose utilization protein [Halohasta litchfieldiae]